MGPDISEFVTAAAQFVNGGKRLRPEFCHAGWCVAGGDPDDVNIPAAAAAFEWLQGSALVHDDLMDGSDTRRGKPAVHVAFAAAQTKLPQTAAERFGMASAILLGDLMLSWADEMLRTSGYDSQTINNAMVHFDQCKTEVVAGQFLDVTGQTRSRTTVAEAMRVVRFKSAKYTVERPLHVGAALAGAPPETIALLSAFGVPLGEAFQLRDDILGVYGDPVITGKPAGDDLREGKRTVLVALAFELSDDAGRITLAEGLGQAEHVDALRRLMTECGARQAVEQQIADLEAECTTALGRIADVAARQRLEKLLVRATRRSH